MTNGGECQAGYYCPEGSWEMVDCTGGWYCNTTGLSAPVGLCDEGWYCPPASSDPRQVCKGGPLKTCKNAFNNQILIMNKKKIYYDYAFGNLL